jgi:translation initiation factor 3 subunit B
MEPVRHGIPYLFTTKPEAAVVGRDKEDRLQSVLRKLFESRGFPVSELDMPFSESDQSKGILFVILKDASLAQQAAAALDGHAFDKRHTLGVHTFEEVERLQTVTDDYEEPAVESYHERVGIRRPKSHI